MIFLDSSVALAAILEEPKRPKAAFWRERLFASRLLELEVYTRSFAYGFPPEAQSDMRDLLAKIDFFEIVPEIVQRMYEPLPVTLRTLDAIHVATAYHLIHQKVPVRLASYDSRMNAAAAALGIPLFDLQ